MAGRRARTGLRKRVARIWDFFRHQQEAGAFLAIVIVSAITFGASQLWPDLEAAVIGSFNISKRGFYLALFLSGLASFAAYLAFNWNEIFRKDQGFSELLRPAERLRVIPIETEAQLREIQEGVVAEVFGSYTPPDEEVYRIFRKNSRRSIGLYSDDLGAFVGFASIWPITPEAARAIKSGERVEEDLTVDDILAGDNNAVAEFAVIPGIAVVPNGAGKTNERGTRLLRAFGGFIGQEYLSGSGRSIELIASAFSTDGLAMCNKFRMTPLGSFDHGSGGRFRLFSKKKNMPLFHKVVTLADLKRGHRAWT